MDAVQAASGFQCGSCRFTQLPSRAHRCTQDLEGGRQGAEATLGALRSPQRELRLKTALLLQLLQSGTLQTQGRAPALRHLVLRLTFNGFLAAA